MAIVKSNRQSYYPPISPNPTAQEMALHLKNLYTGLNNHDSAIDILANKPGQGTSSASGSNTSTIVTKTIITTQLSGLGGVNDQTGSTSYSPTAADAGIFLILGDASPVAVTLNSAMVTPYIFFATNNNTGVITLTPTTGLINGAASWVLPESALYIVAFNGTNWATSVILAFAGIAGVASTVQIGTGTPAAGKYVDGAAGAWTSLPTPPTVPSTIAPVAGEYLTGYNAGTGTFSQSTPAGISVMITTAALTGGGTQGSMTFTAGILTAQVQAT